MWRSQYVIPYVAETASPRGILRWAISVCSSMPWFPDSTQAIAVLFFAVS